MEREATRWSRGRCSSIHGRCRQRIRSQSLISRSRRAEIAAVQVKGFCAKAVLALLQVQMQLRRTGLLQTRKRNVRRVRPRFARHANVFHRPLHTLRELTEPRARPDRSKENAGAGKSTEALDCDRERRNVNIREQLFYCGNALLANLAEKTKRDVHVLRRGPACSRTGRCALRQKLARSCAQQRCKLLRHGDAYENAHSFVIAMLAKPRLHRVETAHETTLRLCTDMPYAARKLCYPGSLQCDCASTKAPWQVFWCACSVSSLQRPLRCRIGRPDSTVEPDERSIYPNLKLTIYKAGMRQNRLAKMVGIHEAYLSRIINGTREPGEELRRNIATALHADPEWLFERMRVVPFPESLDHETRQAS